MRNLISNILNKIKNQPIDIGFFFLFLLTFSLSIRKVMLYFPIQGTFNEYTGIYIYLSDIFLTLAIGSWLFVLLYNKTIKLSNYKLWITYLIHKLYLLLPLLLVIWSFISISWSSNQIIAFYRSVKLLEFYLLYLYIIFRIIPKCSTWNILNFLKIILFTGFIQSCLGIAQFISQKSVGLTFLKESITAPNIPGVAKIVLNGEKYIRAYGLFPHPNILGGFLVFSIILTVLYLKLFHVEQLVFLRNRILNEKGDNIKEYFLTKKQLFENKWLIKAILLIQLAALALTFSKSAILGLIIAFLYISFKFFQICLIVSKCSTWNIWKFYGMEQFNLFKHFRIAILSFLIILTSLWVIYKPDLNSLFFQSLKERLFYLNVPHGTFLDNFFHGTGFGQFVLSIPLFYQKVILPWQHQPIHNVFLLIWTELGIIGFGLFAWLIGKLFHMEQLENKEIGDRKENNLSILNNKYSILSSKIPLIHFKGILLAFIFIMLFDHYFWDIQQGSLLLWMVIGVVAGLNRKLKTPSVFGGIKS